MFPTFAEEWCTISQREDCVSAFFMSECQNSFHFVRVFPFFAEHKTAGAKLGKPSIFSPIGALASWSWGCLILCPPQTNGIHHITTFRCIKNSFTFPGVLLPLEHFLQATQLICFYYIPAGMGSQKYQIRGNFRVKDVSSSSHKVGSFSKSAGKQSALRTCAVCQGLQFAVWNFEFLLGGRPLKLQLIEIGMRAFASIAVVTSFQAMLYSCISVRASE